MFIYVVVVLGLQMFMGNSGILSFAHVGFMGIGAYGSALMSIPADNKRQSLPNLYEPLVGLELAFLPAILVGATAAALFAAITGFAIMRLSDTAAAISTFAVLVIINVVLSQWNEVTNGPRHCRVFCATPTCGPLSRGRSSLSWSRSYSRSPLGV